MRKLKLFLLTFVALLGAVNASGKTVYIQPGNWSNDNAVISVNVWGDGSNVWVENLTEVETGIFKATIGDGKTTMAVVRGTEANKWKSEGAWNQTGDITITDGKLYKLYDYDSSMDGIYVGHGVVEEDYSEPVAAGYVVDFNTAITTSNHDFKVASNWKHIVHVNTNYDNNMSYTYYATSGIDGSGALFAYKQKYYDNGQESWGATTTYDMLVTPVVSGTITIYVKGYSNASSSNKAFLEFWSLKNGATERDTRLERWESSEGTDDYTAVTVEITEPQRIGIRAQYVYMDNFSATTADTTPEAGMSIVSINRIDGSTTTYFDANADGTYTIQYKVKIQNTGDVDLVGGMTENYSLSVSIDGTSYGSFDIPFDLAKGETSEEFVMSIVMPAGAPSGWKYRYLKENLTGTTNRDSKCWSNIIAYNPVPFFIKQGNEPVGKGSSLTSVTSLDFGMITEATVANYEIFAHNAGDLTIKSISVSEGFTVAPAETLPFTITAHTGMNVDVTANGTATAAGNMVITYVNKDGVDATSEIALSQTVIDASKWMATFDGDVWPEGTIHQSSLSFYTSSYYGCDHAIKSSNNYSNLFITPLLHATAGESMNFDAMLDYSNGTIKVYVTNDRNNLGDPVLSLSNSQLNTSSMTGQSITITEAGDYYVVFEIYRAMMDNFYGFEKVPIAHDIMVNSFILSGISAGDKTVQTGDVLSPKFEILPVQSETADAYSVKLYANDEVVATISSEDLVDLTAGTAKTFTFSYTPVVTTTTVLETYAAIEFSDATVVKSGVYNLTVTCEPVFHFVKDLPVNANEPSNHTTPISFGKISTDDTKTFYIYNWGKAPLQVKSINLPEGFTTNLEAPIAVPASTGEALDIIFSGALGNYSGNLTITYVDKDGVDQTFEIAVSGTKLDPMKFYANFDDGGWPAGSVYESNVSSSNIGSNSAPNYAITCTSSNPSIFVTPKLTATAGGKLMFDAKLYSSSWKNGKVVVYAAATRDEVLNAEDGTTRVELFSVSGMDAENAMTTDFQSFEVTVPEAGDYYFGFAISGRPYVDEIYGLTPVAVEHDWQIASSNIPTEAMQNVASTATVNILNLGLAEEAAGSYTVTAYVDGVAAGTGEAVALPMVHQLSAAGTQLSVNYRSPKAGTFPVYLEVKAGDYSVTTAPVDVVFTEEEAKSEADMATNGTAGDSPLNLNYKNSESVTMYNADALAAAGLNAGAKIKKITYKGYKTTDEQTTSFQVYYKWTDDQTLSQPDNDVYPFATTDMIKHIDEDHTWNKIGSSTELGDMIVLDFSESPLTYESGKSLVIYMHSYVDGYKAAYFEKSTLSSDYCYERQKDNATISGDYNKWTKKTPAALHFTLEATATTLSGSVKNASNEGVADATVTLVSDDGDNVQYTGKTDAEGNYTINVIQAARTYNVTVTKAGLPDATGTVAMNSTSQTKDFYMVEPLIVTFVNGAEWENVYAYTYKAECSGTWPGTKISKTGTTTINGDEYDVYTYSLQVLTAPEKIIFNNGGSGEGNQTENLDFAGGQQYEYGVTYYTVAGAFRAEGASADEAGLFGTEWDTNSTANTMTNNGEGVYELTFTNVNLTKGTIKFKVVINHVWDGAVGNNDSGNYEIAIEDNASYNLTIKFDPNATADKITYTLVKSGTVGIANLNTNTTVDGDIYTVGGVRSDKLQKGQMNIIRTKDGKIRKVFVK